MAYTINKTTGEVLITLPDGTADGPHINAGNNASDLDLFGKNYPYYGELLDENFIKLLQNFANATQPEKPLEGELWYDISSAGNHVLRIFNGTSWLPVTPIWSSPSAPVTTQVGAQWWDSTNFQLNMYNGTNWTTVGPGYKAPDGKSGAIVETVYDDGGSTHTVIKFYTNNNVLAIAAYDQPFTLAASSAVTGFTVVSPGITLAGEANNLFHGTATNTQQLGNIAAINYARNDIDSTFYGNLNVYNNNLIISASKAGVSSFKNTVLGANISFFANVNTINSLVLNVNGLTGEVTIQGSPTTDLGVATKAYTDTSIYNATLPLATKASPTFTGIPVAPNPVVYSLSTGQIATTYWTQTAITYSNTAPWQGSQKTVSTSVPTPGAGNPGDFWFQI